MVLVVIDVQQMVMQKELYQYEQFVQNVKNLIETARRQGVEVIHVRHDDGYELTKGAGGFDIFAAFAPKEQEKIFDKHVNSAFKESGLLEYLREKREDTVMVAGLQTDYCMDATIKAGFEHGLHMIVPAYCNTTLDNKYMTKEMTYRFYNEMMWPKRYAECISYEEAIEKLINYEKMEQEKEKRTEMAALTIRRAALSDREGINELLYQVLMVHHNGRPDLFRAGGKKYTDEELDELIEDDKRPIFVAVDEKDKVLGYAFCVFQQHKDDNILTDIRTLYIDDLCVDETRRGAHIGRSLYEHVLNYAREEGCYNVTLNVWACNESAEKFYQKCGLKPQKTGMEKIL